MLNNALVFVKPHAMRENVIAFVKQTLSEYGVQINSETMVTGSQIEQNQIIDRHYFVLAKAGYLEEPQKIILDQNSQQTFASTFGCQWQQAVDDGLVINSKQAVSKVGSVELLNSYWNNAVSCKVASGLYVAQLPQIDRLVINGFYPAMRKMFAEPNSKVFLLDVSFDPEVLSWQKFRKQVIGATNPQKALPGSIRRHIYDHYLEYGFEKEPEIMENTVHASAGTLEGLRERFIWLNYLPKDQEFGQLLLKNGIAEPRLTMFLNDPQVEFNGERVELFTLTEDLDAKNALAILKEVK